LVPLLERFDVAQVAVSPLEGRGEHYDRWQQLLARRSPDTVMTLSAGQQWTPEPDFALHVCWPPAGTPGPLVLRLRYRERRLLLGGDATAQVEGALIAAGGNDLRSDVLLLPRHGAATAAQAAFLRAVKPEFVAVSLGRGQPLDRRLQARLMDIPIYRTDQHGRIHFKTDGQQVWVDVKRSPK
jgi:beta-lactamase superfamily II metal-dependent hydrolase